MLAQSNPGAGGFSPQQATLRIHYLATEKLFFGIRSAIRFILDSLLAHQDTLWYPGKYRLGSFEDRTI